MKSERLYQSEIVELRSVLNLVDTLPAPLTAATREHLEEALELEARQVERAFRQRTLEEVETAGAEFATARREAAECDGRLSEWTARLAVCEQSPHGGWLRTAVFALCAIACFAAEFALTWETLPFLLDVRKYSWLGVALGLAPTTALLILDVVLARLLEEPWQRLAQPGAQSPWQRRAVRTLMALFLVGVAWGNVQTVLYLAEAREEAAKQKAVDGIAALKPVEVDTGAILRAILAVSLVVTVDGAMFFLLGLQDGRRLGQLARARLRCRSLARESRKLASGRDSAEARLAVKRNAWDGVKDGAELAAGRFRSLCRVSIEKKLAERQKRESLEMLVEDRLRLRAMGGRPARRSA
jgi:hypothetical protein